MCCGRLPPALRALQRWPGVHTAKVPLHLQLGSGAVSSLAKPSRCSTLLLQRLNHGMCKSCICIHACDRLPWLAVDPMQWSADNLLLLCRLLLERLIATLQLRLVWLHRRHLQLDVGVLSRPASGPFAQHLSVAPSAQAQTPLPVETQKSLPVRDLALLDAAGS